MSIFSHMEVYCPICRHEFDGMHGYGRDWGKWKSREIRRDWKCCSKECHDEAEWRRTLAIMGKPYHQRAEKGTPRDE